MKKKLLIGLLLGVAVVLVSILPALLSQKDNNATNPTQQEGMVQVRVCGVNGIVFDELTDASGCTNAKQLLEKAVGAENVVYDQKFITSVMGVDGVVYYTVKDNGVYEAPAVSVEEYPITGLRELVFYNYKLAPMAVDAVKQGNEVTLTVTKAEFDANFAIVGWVPLQGATAELAENTVVTDADGIATLPMPNGAEIIQVYAKDAAGNYSTVPRNIAVNELK